MSEDINVSIFADTVAKSIPPRRRLGSIESIMPPKKKTKPNDKCHCGSGKKHKKCCMVAGKIASSVVFTNNNKAMGRISIKFGFGII